MNNSLFMKTSSVTQTIIFLVFTRESCSVLEDSCHIVLHVTCMDGCCLYCRLSWINMGEYGSHSYRRAINYLQPSSLFNLYHSININPSLIYFSSRKNSVTVTLRTDKTVKLTLL